jgi:hypothetical protein
LTELTMYDSTLDAYRAVTQEDVRKWEEFVAALADAPLALADAPPVPQGAPFQFRLACFPNKLRSGELFVAEDLPIQPYANILDPQGRFVYPSIPRTPWHLRNSLSRTFAQELVRRWNRAGADATRTKGRK